MKTVALIEQGSDGLYTIHTPDLNHTLMGTGATVVEAKADFENSLEEIKAYYLEDKGELPKELKGLTVEYKFDLSSFFNYYSWINASKLASIAGINASLMRQYKKGITYISENQSKKIETTLHRLGRELTAVQL